MNVLLEKVRDAEPVGGGENALFNGFGSNAAASQCKGDFVADVERKELFFGILEKRAHVFGELRHGRFRNVAAGDAHGAHNLSAVDLRAEAVREPHEGGLPAPGGAGDDLKFARVHRERNISHGLFTGVGVDVGDVFEFNHRHRMRLRVNASW